MFELSREAVGWLVYALCIITGIVAFAYVYSPGPQPALATSTAITVAPAATSSPPHPFTFDEPSVTPNQRTGTDPYLHHS